MYITSREKMFFNILKIIPRNSNHYRMIILSLLRVSLDLSKYFCSVFTADFSKYFDKFLDRLAIAYLQIKFVNGANYSGNKRVLTVDFSIIEVVAEIRASCLGGSH